MLTIPKLAIQTSKPVFIIGPVAIKIYTAVESFLNDLQYNDVALLMQNILFSVS